MSVDLGGSPPLSARSALENALYKDAKYPADVLHHLIDAFAHELAEQQRNWDAEAAGFTDPQSAVYAVADLIDPEVSK